MGIRTVIRRITKEPVMRDQVISSKPSKTHSKHDKHGGAVGGYPEETLSLNSDSNDSFDSRYLKTIQRNIEEVVAYNVHHKERGHKGEYQD